MEAINENEFSENPIEEVLTLSRICDLLELKRQTIYSYVSRGLIPYHKKAGKLYFFRQEIEKWIKSGNRSEKIEGISFNPRRKFKDRKFKKV
ncbi:helix-turn-helix domain-containing protein [Echinicola shivajiensis]|uniref:helix-turn-helix domain-containing protein n=1 Tax=Echinicola shivajiensis TaxID=1035916 RepID=UPI001BFCC404|nr:helix-turn-helix domain-containing protein [Echinicola shivajiensis]